MEFIDVSAKTVEDAIAQGKEQLHQDGREFVSSEVVTQSSNGFLGFGRKPAVVRLYFTTSEREDVVVARNEEDTVSEETMVQTTEVDHVRSEDDCSSSVEVEDHTNDVLTKEVQDMIAKKGKQFLDDMLSQMGLSVMIEKMTTQDKIIFQIHGEELGILIGKHGQTLDAIQYLTNLVAHKEVNGHCHIVVDVENYRSRREETLQVLAKRLASKVKRTRQKVSLEPMNAFERKLIHTALQNDAHIVTDSEGEEPYRHVVISYKR